MPPRWYGRGSGGGPVAKCGPTVRPPLWGPALSRRAGNRHDGWVSTNRSQPNPSTTTSRRGRGRPPLVLIALGALAIGLAACGGSSSSSSTTTQAPPTTSGGTGTTSTTGSSTSTTTSITTCHSSGLTATLGSPNGSAGASHYEITFRNTGSAACTLFGYPGVSFLDAKGSQIGSSAQRQATGQPATITLAGGGNAFSSLAVTDPGIPPCSSSTAAAKVRIYPPGDTQSLLVTAPTGMLVCSSPNTAGYLSSIVTSVSAASF